MTRKEEQGRYQMLWDCAACGAKGLLGLDHRFCPSCGAAQDPKLRYFPPEEAKVAVEDHPYHGADKVCPACDTPNSGASAFCQACGSPLDGASEAAVRTEQRTAEGLGFSDDDAKNAKQEHRDRKRAEEADRIQAMSGQVPPKPKKKFRWALYGCLSLIGLTVLTATLFCLLSWLWATTAPVTVQSHSWNREIQVEQYGPVRGTAWREDMPRAARDISCRQEEKTTRRVADGEDCDMVRKDKGDGTFSEVRECRTRYRSEPVYADRCSYTIDDWKVVRTERASGSGRSPTWPEVRLSGSRERQGRRSDTYTVVVQGTDGQTHSCNVDESRWNRLEPRATVEATFGGITGMIDCGSLRP